MKNKARARNFQLLSLLTCGVAALSQQTQAQQAAEEIIVEGVRPKAGVEKVQHELRKRNVNFYTFGGVAKIPVINGMNDERVKVLVDGTELPSSCGNHMNPALSYADTSNIESVQVFAGITPVSVGGDSIAGTIVLDSASPSFAGDDSILLDGLLQLDYLSNNQNGRESLTTTIANQNWSLNYAGSNDKADSGEDGYGDVILDSLYRVENHALTLGHRAEKSQFTAKFSYQDIPYQGFPNQYMDMTSNRSDRLNLHYARQQSWGKWETRLTWQDTQEKMGFFSDEKTGSMVMHTDATNTGWITQAELRTGVDSKARLGVEIHQFNLDDYWPAVEDSMMMGPNTFVNINGGERQRVALWLETDAQFTKRVRTRFGLRYENVTTDTGNVQSYSEAPLVMMMPNVDAVAAENFNAKDKSRQDDNIDFTASLEFEPAENQTWEFGYARKTRSPNLYERYSWGRSDMAMTMIGWFGDGNGYVGSIDVEPEIAHTLGLQVERNGGNKSPWHFNFNTYYSYVDDYIDARVIGDLHPQMSMEAERRKLQFTNEDAIFYGANIGAGHPLWQNSTWGTGKLSWTLSYQKGDRQYDGGSLYQIKPVTALVGFEHTLNRWQNYIEVNWVNDKKNIDRRRLERETGAYTLLNLGTRYDWKNVYFKLALNNALDEHYHDPLGGVSIAQWQANGRTAQFPLLSGQGRSINTGIGIRF